MLPAPCLWLRLVSREAREAVEVGACVGEEACGATVGVEGAAVRCGVGKLETPIPALHSAQGQGASGPLANSSFC